MKLNKNDGSHNLGIVDALLLIFLFTAATAYRWEFLPWAFMGVDSLGPLWRTWRIWALGEALPHPHAFGYGFALYYGYLPAFLGASSLTALVQAVAIQSACLSPLLYLILRRLPYPSPIGRAMGVLAALLMVFSVDLIDIILSGARTYTLPLYTAAISLGVLALIQDKKAAPYFLMLLLPSAVMTHPYGAALWPPTLLALMILRKRIGLRHLALAMVLGGICFLPHLYQHWQVLSDAIQGVHAPLEQLAQANGQYQALSQQLWRAVHDGYWIGSPAARTLNAAMAFSPLMLLGIGTMNSTMHDEHRHLICLYALWVLGLSASIVGVAFVTQYIQHYHLRVLLPAFALTFAWVLGHGALWVYSKIGATWPSARSQVLISTFFFSLFVLLGCLYQQDRTELIRGAPNFDALAHHQEIAAEIWQHKKGQSSVIDTLHIEENRQLYPAAIVLDHLLRGQNIDSFPTRPEGMESANQYLIVVMPQTLAESWLQPRHRAHVVALQSALIWQRKVSEAPGHGPVSLLLFHRPNAQSMIDLGESICETLPAHTSKFFGSPYDYMAQLDRHLESQWIGLWRAPCLTPSAP